jgi:hypothetical protein
VAAEVTQSRAAVVIGRRGIWIDRDRLTKQFDGALGAAGLKRDGAQQKKCAEVGGLTLENLLADMLRLGQLALPV